MIYPKSLKDNDTIGIIAPSNGIIKERKIKALNVAKEHLINNGFIIDESKDIRKSVYGVSNTAKDRAEDFMKYIKNKDIDCIITATGGDFLIEILEYINFNDILKNIKWIQGHSDTTNLLYILTTALDIATIYSCNVTGFGYESLHESQLNNIKILKGDMISQNSYDYYEPLNQKETERLKLSVKTSWKIIGKEKSKLNGRIIGGCLDCLLDIVGTKFDYTNKFIDKYSNNKIIWYFDVSDLTNEDILRGIWQLRNAGWFKNTIAVMFGRLKHEVSYTGITLSEAISRALKNDEICVITDVDLGHTNPKFTIINGAITNININDGKGEISFELQ